MTHRPSRIVREREPGESAAHAVLARLRQDVSERNLYGGVVEGYDDFMRCIQEAPSLMARPFVMQQRTAESLALTLREETDAAAGDPLPELVAHQLVHIGNVVFRAATRGVANGEPPEEVVRDALRRVEVFESLVSSALLNYAVRPRE